MANIIHTTEDEEMMNDAEESARYRRRVFSGEIDLNDARHTSEENREDIRGLKEHWKRVQEKQNKQILETGKRIFK